MERPGPTGLLAGRLVELELQHPSEEVARIGGVAGDVELGARIEAVGVARDRGVMP